jgi:hypothetical protein
MRHSFWNKRIPSIAGLLFLAITVGIISWFGTNVTNLRGRAAEGDAPKNVRISNITDTAFTISYSTDNSVFSAIVYGENPESGQAALDDRDFTGGTSQPRKIHYITIRNLNPNTKYYFTIQSAGTTYLNNSLPYEVTTANKIIPTSPQGPITGRVNLLDGSIPLDGIVYVSATTPSAPIATSSSGKGDEITSQLVSGLIAQDGSYSLPVNTLRDDSLTSFFQFSSKTILNMTIESISSQSRVTLFASASNPVPLVSLTKDYDFTIQSASTTSETNKASESAKQPPADFPEFPSGGESTPSILTPTEEEAFIDLQPTFSGTAVPNETVEITIESGPLIQASIQADSSGNWEYRPDTPLSPGEHVITIITRDALGIEQIIKRSFTVYAQGSQFTEPSISPTDLTGTLTPTVSPRTPTATPIIASPTPSPTIEVTPVNLLTPTVTPVISQPTITPLFTVTPTPALPSVTPADSTLIQPTIPAIPESGGIGLFFAGFAALVSIGAGFVLFFW